MPRPGVAAGAQGFLRANARFLGFGFALTFFSSLGQTFHIALFADEVRAEFALGHQGYGALYSAATLVSGISLIWVGQLLDRVDLRRFTAVACAGLVAACFLFGAAGGLVALGLALFSLRLFGQGLLGHTAFTSMGRYFEAERGRATSVAFLGFAAGTAVFPPLAVAVKANLGWRSTWFATGAVLAPVLVPLVLWLLRGHAERHARFVAEIGEARRAGADAAPARRQWTRRDVLGDWRFYLVLPAVVSTPFLMTGFLFHEVHLVQTKGWTMAWWATCFIAFAVAQWGGLVLIGGAVDRWSGRRLLPWTVVPLGVGALLLSLGSAPAVALAFLMLAGLTMAAQGTASNALWAELYGVLHLGSIRAFTAACMVLSTAVAPVLFGTLLDAGVSFEAIAFGAAVYVGAAVVLALAALKNEGAAPAGAAPSA